MTRQILDVKKIFPESDGEYAVTHGCKPVTGVLMGNPCGDCLTARNCPV